jgi:hypothetical protein
MKFNPYTPHPASSNAAGAKEMQLPEDASRQHQTDSTLIKALEAGELASNAELAEQEGIAPSYMTRVLRIALLPPVVFEGILAGHRTPEMRFAQLLQTLPAEWSSQTWTGR